MPPEHQIRIDELKRFYEDFRRFHRLLLDQRSAESTARSGQNRTPPEELEELRQTLLRTRGAVEPLFERVIGRLLQPTPHGQVDAWELALYKQYPYNQAF